MRNTILASRRWALAFALVALGALPWIACSKKAEPARTQTQTPAGEQFRVRHMLLQYKGAEQAGDKVTRSKAAAESLLTALRGRVERGESFADLARTFSDDASASEGGEIAPLKPGETPPDFEHAAMALQPGEMSPVFVSPLGFHLIQRLGGERIAAQHILIRYHGAQAAPDSVRRTRIEALALTEKLLGQVNEPDVSFPVAAAAFSEDEQNAAKGGYLGEFGPGQMAKAFEAAAFALQVGQISKVVETPFGFHIIKRVPIESIRVAHILVTHRASDGLEQQGRSEDEALRRALDVLFRAKKGDDFESLAREYSDDKLTATRGGRLPILSRGQTVPEFEEAAFGLKPGQVSEVVKTQFGFHVIKRIY